jgi:transglutaminase-like putative cysteine protease
VIKKKEERIARPPKMRLDSEFTKPSRWITSDNESVRRMGVMVAGNSVLPEDKCLRLTDAVFEKMKGSAFSTSLVPASDVIRNLRGDCTEHAVLLAALMRSQGVPSRVAIGFVHVPNPASFAPHMWTEAFIDEKWVPFDATRGSRGIGMTHVKVGDSPLSDDVASGTILFVQLLPFLGRTTVDYVPQSEFAVKP